MSVGIHPAVPYERQGIQSRLLYNTGRHPCQALICGNLTTTAKPAEVCPVCVYPYAELVPAAGDGSRHIAIHRQAVQDVLRREIPHENPPDFITIRASAEGAISNRTPISRGNTALSERLNSIPFPKTPGLPAGRSARPPARLGQGWRHFLVTCILQAPGN